MTKRAPKKNYGNLKNTTLSTRKTQKNPRFIT